MRKIFFALLFMFSFNIKAQQLSLKDLIFLLNCNLEQADSLLSAKKYEYYKQKSDTTSTSLWAFNATKYTNAKYQEEIKANRFLRKWWKKDDNPISYGLAVKDDYENLRKECKKNGFVYSHSYVDDDDCLTHVFNNKKYRIIFSSSNDKDKSLNYVFLYYL